MKPTLIAFIALMCLGLVFSAPSPTIVLGTTGSVVGTSVILGSGTSIGTAAALVGLKKLALAGILIAGQNA